MKLSNMSLPAMTFCHKGLQKYGIVERLANFIDTEKEIPKEVFDIRNEFIELLFADVKKLKNNAQNFCEWLFDHKIHPILRGKTKEHQDILKSDCYICIAIPLILLIITILDFCCF